MRVRRRPAGPVLTSAGQWDEQHPHPVTRGAARRYGSQHPQLAFPTRRFRVIVNLVTGIAGVVPVAGAVVSFLVSVIGIRV